MTPTLQRTSRAITALMIRWPFYGSLAFRLNVIESADITTAATDGKSILINSAYATSMDDKHLVGLMAHEILHCAFLHMTRTKGRDHNLWNLACDYAIDHIIVASGMVVPDATINPDWIGWTAEMIYAALLKDKGKQKQARDQVMAAGSLSQGKGKPGSNQDEKSATQAEATALSAEWTSAVIASAAIAKGRGNLPGALQMLIQDLMEPAIDWRSELLRFMQQTARSDFTWTVPSRRYLDTGFILPSMRSYRMPPVVICNDVSGSLWDEEVQASFASEVRAAIDACNPEAAYLLDFDSEVRNTHVVEEGDDVDFNHEGGGGTKFEPMFDWVEKEGVDPACMIVLTDLCGTFPDAEPDYPVLWASTNKRRTAPFGEVLYVH